MAQEPSLRELIESGPPPAAQPERGGERQPLGGMPEGPPRSRKWQGGFRGFQDAPSVATGSRMTTSPRYWTDDEWQPSRWSPERIATLQRDLASAGLIGKNDRITFGVWDPKSASAFRELLGYANSTGLPWENALDLYASTPEMDGGQERQPLMTRLSNPADLRSIFKEAATKYAGEAPDDEVEKMVAAYQAQEASVQQTAYGMQETGGTVTEQASPDAFAEDYLRREKPVETGAVDMLEQLNAASDWLFG